MSGKLLVLVPGQKAGLAGKNLNDHRVIFMQLLKLQSHQNLLDQTVQMLVRHKRAAIGNILFLQSGNDAAVLTNYKVNCVVFPQFHNFIINQVFNGISILCSDPAGPQCIVCIDAVDFLHFQKIGHGVTISNWHQKIHSDPAEVHALGVQNDP